MNSLEKDLQLVKYNLEDFRLLTLRILDYLPLVVSGYEDKNDYRIFFSEIAGTKKFIRPINIKLFLSEKHDFEISFSKMREIFELVKVSDQSSISGYQNIDISLIDKVLYTIQQSIGAGLDLLANPNSARKHVGNRFEELIRVVFTEIGISNKKLILQIPYRTEEGNKIYQCENDLIISPYSDVRSSTSQLDLNEIVVSTKTTSKDRMGKLFIDKMLMEKFVNHPQKVVAVFLNDVQRKEDNNISFTLVSGLFMVYSQFLTKIDGIYYLDLPPSGKKAPLSEYLKPFSQLLCNDIWKLFPS
jgi:hypothetical protein